MCHIGATGNLPVIVVVVHLERETAYWKSFSAGQDPAARRLRFDKDRDKFDVSARDAIADLCVAKGGFGVWLPTLKANESGHLNLLEVIFPENIYVAASPFKTGRHALRVLLDHEPRPPGDWIIRGGQFMSFRDPRESCLAQIVDVGSVEPIASEEIAFPDDEVDERNIIELLRRTLGAQIGLAYERTQKAYYFPAAKRTIYRSYSYKSLKQRASADVVKMYEK